jgi:steroid delta-isomerase-like uncharacterized protein
MTDLTELERALGTRWFEEVWNKGNRAAIAEMLAPEAILHEGDTDSIGPEGFYAFYDRLNAAFSEFRVTIHDTIVEGDRVCVRWSCRCKHTGDALGMPATQKDVHVTGMSILRVANGQMVEGWQNWDMLGMLEQIHGSNRSVTYVAAR